MQLDPILVTAVGALVAYVVAKFAGRAVRAYRMSRSRRELLERGMKRA